VASRILDAVQGEVAHGLVMGVERREMSAATQVIDVTGIDGAGTRAAVGEAGVSHPQPAVSHHGVDHGAEDLGGGSGQRRTGPGSLRASPAAAAEN